MGFSKKKAKNKKKADSRIGPKAKAKIIKKKQIETREQVKESKRKASALLRPSTTQSGSSVDDLFKSFGEEDDDAEMGRMMQAASDSEESAGAFHDVSDGEGELGDDLGEEDLEGLHEGDAAARHEEELKAIKIKDPDFYKFLVEQDRALLDFRAADVRQEEDDEDGAEAEEDFAAVQAGMESSALAENQRVLTLDRFHALEAAAMTSFTSFKATLNAFHTAVRSIGGGPQAAGNADDDHGVDDGDEASKAEAKKNREKQRKKDSKEKKRSVAAKTRSMKRALLRIDNEATFSAVLEWSISNVLGLLRHYASAEQGSGKRKLEPKSGAFDPTKLNRYSRVKVLSNIFWEETLFLLNQIAAPEMLEFVLRHCSTPEALSWLWPFKNLRRHFFKRCFTLWASGESQTSRLLAFLFIRNAGAMAMRHPEKMKTDVPQLEQLMRGVIKSFADVASWGYSWRSVSTFRFMENCMLELFRLEDATAYRVGYLCIRQLALLLRNACIAGSQAGHEASDGHKSAKAVKAAKGRGKGATKPGAAGSKKRATQLKQAQSLVAWPFVRAVYLWTKAVGTLPALRPLAYPLFMIVMGAVKSKLTSLQHFPFVFHLIHCLNRLASTMELFVPVSSHLLKALAILVQTMEKRHKLGRRASGKHGDAAHGEQLLGTKAPEIEVLLHFAQNQVNEVLTQEAIGSCICALFTDHLGLLSRSMAFPEVAAPVLLHLRRHSKHCRSDALRRQLKNIVTAAEASSAHVRARREQLTELPSAEKLLSLEADATALARQRTQLNQRRAAEERSRVEAELLEQAASKAQDAKKGKRKAEEADQPKEGKKAAKRRRQAEEKREALEAATALPNATTERPIVVALAAGAAKTTDRIEEMDFSSAESE